jgi:hypothetical protein
MHRWNDASSFPKKQPHQPLRDLGKLYLFFIQAELQCRAQQTISAIRNRLGGLHMKNKGFCWGIKLGVLMLAVSISALAQRPRETHFRGTISDYTPLSVGGPWEVRGTWSLTVRRDGKANFSAALNMERSDLGVMQSGGGDLNNPMDRMAHTHHFTLVDGAVTFPSEGTIEITGPITITANGNFPPPFGPTSSVTIDVTGGNSVTFSNIKLTFSSDSDAVTHFGPNPINGVVRSVREGERR